ncbi:MAG TPA: hypothetical protein PLP19_18520 [bacterium]|nr:hypothetical protein [bacterium]HPN45493.1 hypothetical protein [bacterium]
MDNIIIVLLVAIFVLVLGQLFMIIGMNKKINILKKNLGVDGYDEKDPPPPPPPPPPPTGPK